MLINVLFIIFCKSYLIFRGLCAIISVCKKLFFNVWLIYAYHRDTGEIVAFVWGKRNLKTAKKLRKKLSSLDLSFDTIYTDDWESFSSAFTGDNHMQEKKIQLVLRVITADYVIGSGVHSEKLVVFPKNCITIWKHLIWHSFISITDMS